jgi:hypothetical protein
LKKERNLLIYHDIVNYADYYGPDWSLRVINHLTGGIALINYQYCFADTGIDSINRDQVIIDFYPRRRDFIDNQQFAFIIKRMIDSRIDSAADFADYHLLS